MFRKYDGPISSQKSNFFFFFNHWSSPFRVFFFVRLLYVNKSFGCKLVNEFNPVGFVQFSLMLIYSKMHKK